MRCLVLLIVCSAQLLWLVRHSAARDAESMRRAQRMFQQREWAAAERECLAAIREQPGDARAYKLLGMVYAAQEQFDKADQPFERACQLDPRDETACYYLGRNHYALSRYAESRSVLEKALHCFPNSRRIKAGLGLTLEALGHPEEAANYLRDAARDGNLEALSEYGQFLFRQGRLEEGAEVLRRAGSRDALDRALRQLASRPTTPSQVEPVVPVRFSRSELPMIVRNGAAGDKHQVETMIAGIAVFDYDGDGWPDIYVSNGATLPDLVKKDRSYANRLFRNNQDGTLPTSRTGQESAAGDTQWAWLSPTTTTTAGPICSSRGSARTFCTGTAVTERSPM